MKKLKPSNIEDYSRMIELQIPGSGLWMERRMVRKIYSHHGSS